jgi:hypothetical protein
MAMLGLEDYVIPCARLSDQGLLWTKLDKVLNGRDSLRAHLSRKKAEFYGLVMAFAKRWDSVVAGGSPHPASGVGQ